MGTRGLYGVVVNGEVKASYNHFDSYPSGLGADIVKFVQGIENVADTFEQAQNLTLVDESEEPTPLQVQKIAGQDRPDAAVGGDWYGWLRDAQGDLAENLRIGFMTNGVRFGEDSLFCEWGYLVNLDDETVEVYRGFQKEPHTGGRWSDYDPTTVEDEPGAYINRTYYGIKQIDVIPFSELDDTRMARIEADVYGEED